MKREDIFELLEACVIAIDGGEPKDYFINPLLAEKGKKLADYLLNLEIEVSP